MNDAPRQKLREIIERHGRFIIENPRRVENLLRDYCGEFRREISVLTMALEEHAVADMLTTSASVLPRKVMLARLAQRLSDNLALSETAAVWSIESWALAFDIISEAELTVNNGEVKTKQAGFETIQQKSTAPIAARVTQTSQAALAKQSNVTKNTYVVSTNGGGDFKSISEALRNVAPNSRLLIREGLYNESIVIDKNIEIFGDGASEKIVVQSANQSCLSMQTETASVRNLTLRGLGKFSGRTFFAVDVPRGELILENCRISSDSLSCIAVHGANANPSIKNCWISDGADSGIYVFDNARAHIESCDVYNNANVNLAIAQGANPSVKKCRIYAGKNGGVVVWGNGATGTIEDCEISGHRLANVGVSQTANPLFRRCAIFNGLDSGVFIHQNGYGVFEECEVYSNHKAEIAVTDKSNTTLRRCVVHDGRESGIYVGNQARALVESCNVYDNADAGIYVYGESQIAVRRCNIHRNGTVAVRVKERSQASVEGSDLRGNRIATWETEHGVTVERNNNRER